MGTTYNFNNASDNYKQDDNNKNNDYNKDYGDDYD